MPFWIRLRTAFIFQVEALLAAEAFPQRLKPQGVTVT